MVFGFWILTLNIGYNSMQKSNNENLIKRTLAIFSLTCCEGCQFAILKSFDNFEKLQNFYQIKNFRLGQEENLPGPFDVALVEGTPESEREIKLIKDVRKNAKIVIVLGTCADLGGIQSERNRLPKKYIGREKVKSIHQIIKIDYIVPGCPIDHKELFNCLLNLSAGKIFRLPTVGVCFECRENQNKCLIKEGKPCLGPVTRAGCNSICVNGGEMCLGCRGALPQANFHKLREVLATILDEEEINNLLTIYGDIENG